METDRERYLRLAKESRELATTVVGLWKRDCLIVADIWEKMAAEELKRILNLRP